MIYLALFAVLVAVYAAARRGAPPARQKIDWNLVKWLRWCRINWR